MNAIPQHIIRAYTSWIFAPFLERFRLTEASQTAAASGIFGLLLFGYKAAIARFVISIHINAINSQIVSIAMLYCPISKCAICAPFRAKGYSSPAIMGKRSISWIGATVEHGTPRLIEATMRIAVNIAEFASNFSLITTARNRGSILQGAKSHHRFNPAYTSHLTETDGRVWRMNIRLDDSPSPKPIPDLRRWVFPQSGHIYALSTMALIISFPILPVN